MMEEWKNACPVKCDVGAISTGEIWKEKTIIESIWDDTF